MAKSLSDQLHKVVNGNGKVRRKLREIADRGAERGRSIAATEDPGVEIGRASGIRPGTHADPDNFGERAFERITAPAEQEHGTATRERRRILGRVWAEL